MITTQIDHNEYQKRVKGKNVAELQYIVADAKKAIIAMPDGHKAGYYADEIHYCLGELNTRKASQYSIGNRVEIVHQWPDELQNPKQIYTNRFGVVDGYYKESIIVQLESDSGFYDPAKKLYISCMIVHPDNLVKAGKTGTIIEGGG